MTTEPQVRLGAIYPNSGARSSGKTGKKAVPLAAEIARQLGMVPTWPNVQTIRLAIESEAEFSSVSIAEAAAVIVEAARERSTGSMYRPAANWEEREFYRENSVDRFWFEDARWRTKFAYASFQSRLKQWREPGIFCPLPRTVEAA